MSKLDETCGDLPVKKVLNKDLEKLLALHHQVTGIDPTPRRNRSDGWGFTFVNALRDANDAKVTSTAFVLGQGYDDVERGAGSNKMGTVSEINRAVQEWGKQKEADGVDLRDVRVLVLGQCLW